MKILSLGFLRLSSFVCTRSCESEPTLRAVASPHVRWHLGNLIGHFTVHIKGENSDNTHTHGKVWITLPGAAGGYAEIRGEKGCSYLLCRQLPWDRLLHRRMQPGGGPTLSIPAPAVIAGWELSVQTSCKTLLNELGLTSAIFKRDSSLEWTVLHLTWINMKWIQSLWPVNTC